VRLIFLVADFFVGALFTFELLALFLFEARFLIVFGFEAKSTNLVVP